VAIGIAALNPLLAGAPAISSFAWVYARTLSATGAVTDNMAIAVFINSSSAGNALRVSGNTTSVGLLSRSQTADSIVSSTGTTGSFQTVRWCAIGGVSNYADKSVTLYTDGQRVGFTGGVSYGANAYTPGTPTFNDRLGALDTTDTTRQWNGFIAHAALWRTALTDADYAALAAGVSPLAIRRESLVSYFPLQDSQGIHDVVGGVRGTITGSVPIDEDPRSLWTPSTLLAPQNNLAKTVAILEAA
jgi:hypothetical protein